VTARAAPPAPEHAGAPPDGAAWLRHMRRGAWADAWAVSDAVLRARGGTTSVHLQRHEQWIWDGTPLDGRRVLVRCYHGLGDTLQFARFVPPLRAVAAEVTLWAQPALLPLLATMEGVGPLEPLHDGAFHGEYDVDVEVMELAHVAREGGRLAVGLVWECGDWDRATRSIPLPLLAPLAAVPGVALHLLQRGDALAACDPALGAPSGHDDVLEAARVMRALDLVVSVDTMPAHLAGVLGVPVWTLLPHTADWRWMDDRDSSPWYPTMRLFRQPRPGDWQALLARVAGELAALAAGPRSGESPQLPRR
jgi:hypothetical protein